MKWNQIIFGQFLTVCIVSISFMAQLQNMGGFDSTLTDILILYLFLFLINLLYFLFTNQINSIFLNKRVYTGFLIISLIDSQANIFLILGFKYATGTIYSIIISLSAPSAALFSILFLKRQYFLFHYLGISICVIGVVISVISDIHSNMNELINFDIFYFFIGTLFFILAIILFALSNVLQEKFLSEGIYQSQYLFYLGLFSFILIFIEFIIIGEYRRLVQINQKNLVK